jgi:type III pantothenate kinase
MSNSSPPELIAIDIGNTRLKVGRFELPRAETGRLPEPRAALATALTEPYLTDALEPWLADLVDRPTRWIAASVNDRALERVSGWLAEHGVSEVERLVDPHRLRLRTALAAPERVGIDRLLNALAVNVVRPADRPAIVVDAGSAVTVDAVSIDGVFLGGAIFPGIGLCARALAEYTEKLPLIEVGDLLCPPTPGLPGTSTASAIAGGLFWSLVGAVREVASQTTARLSGEPVLVLTGGAAEPLAPHLGPGVQWLPHLTLQGIAVAFR